MKGSFDEPTRGFSTRHVKDLDIWAVETVQKWLKQAGNKMKEESCQILG